MSKLKFNNSYSREPIHHPVILTLDWPIALADKYSNLYPFASILENSWATPSCAQSRPTIGKMCPRTSDLREKSKKISSLSGLPLPVLENSLCDGAIDVRNDNFIIVLPSEQIAFAPRGPLIRRRHTEHHLIHAFLQIQTIDLVWCQSQRFLEFFVGNLAVDTFVWAQCGVDGSCRWIGCNRFRIHIPRCVRSIVFAGIDRWNCIWLLTFPTRAAPIPPRVSAVRVLIGIAVDRLGITWMVQFRCLLTFQLLDGILEWKRFIWVFFSNGRVAGWRDRTIALNTEGKKTKQNSNLLKTMVYGMQAML